MPQRSGLIHPPDELVDVILAVSGVAAFDVVIPLLLQPAQRRLQLEGPKEVVRLLEVRPDGHDFVNEILDANNTVLPQTLETK